MPQIIVDVSPVGQGVVLTQVNKDGLRITAMEAGVWKVPKRALALIWACEKFHFYIYGVPFELVTDHKPLEEIYGHEV